MQSLKTCPYSSTDRAQASEAWDRCSIHLRGTIFFTIFILLFFSVPLSAAPKKPIPETQKTPPIIIIDPGHGGKDPGAISKFGIREKSLVLSIAKRLSVSLKQKLGAVVRMTRATDIFIPLGKRDQIANHQHCDFFISIHANSSPIKKAQGIEVYYLNKATDKASRKLAARENAGSPKNEKEIGAILSDLLQTAATEESAELAQHMVRGLRQHLKKYKMTDPEVKTALFYILVGSKCPSLLIETGFITNPEESRRLKSASYQKAMADGISEAVSDYLKDVSKNDL